MNATGARRRSWRLLAAVGLFLVLDTACGAVQATLRDRRWQRTTADAAAVDRGYRTAHPYYHHDLVAGHESPAIWGPNRYTVRTNSLGFRDARAREVPMRADRPRILLLGDSFTEGIGVEYESTMAGHLARSLDPRGVDVLNAGVGSYSPAIYWKKIEYLLERRGLEVDAVVVLIDISDIQDDALWYRIDTAGRVVDAPEPPYDAAAGWRRSSMAFRLFVRAADWVYPHPPWIGCSAGRDSPRTREAYGDRCRSAWTLSPVAMRRYGRDGLSRASEHMTRLAELLRRRGIPLTVAVYPWPQQLLWDDRDSLQVRHWREWAAREGAGFIDLFETFFDAVDAQGRDDVIRQYFIAGDTHWSAPGHRLVADAVEPHLTRLTATITAAPRPWTPRP